MDICLKEIYTERKCPKCGNVYENYSYYEIMTPKGVIEEITNSDCPHCGLEEKVKKAS